MVTFLLGFFGLIFVMSGNDRYENWIGDGWAISQMAGGGLMIAACAFRVWLAIEAGAFDG